jgi:CDP-4-dehydro-6-deoxyglucose reductase
MESGLKTYSSEELLFRNGVNSPEIWVAYKGYIYDVTSSELFKGGKHYFHLTGIDLTAEMENAPHLEDVMARFQIVGKLGEGSIIQQTTLVESKTHNHRIQLKLIDKILVSSDVFRFSFQIISPSIIHFNEGQYLKLHVNIDGEEVKRSYSIASRYNDQSLDFLIQHVPGGKATEFLVHRLEHGEIIAAEGPFGNFSTNLAHNKSVCFICTDVGIGPIRPMIHQLFKNNTTSKPIYLIYGNRFASDVLYHEEWKTLDFLKDNFTYLPTLSREVKSGFDNGYVHNAYKIVLNTPETIYFIVGWQNMVEETKRNLIQAGINKEEIFVQLYC